jgi:uncharacterized iron-regulated membrane protein
MFNALSPEAATAALYKAQNGHVIWTDHPCCVADVVMLKAYALRFHRWITLLFAVPLLVVIGTGLILSFEPLAQQARLDRPLTAEAVLGWLGEHDPGGKATGLSVRAYEQTLTIAGVGEDGETEIDLRTGEVEEAGEGGFAWSEVFRTSRRLHETLLLDLGWLVTASTFAMLAIAALGILMGLPRPRNTLGGWHNAAAWGALPLVVLSPLTGLAIVYGVTFLPAQQGPRPPPVTVREAVEKVAAAGHDLGAMTSLRPRGGRMIARIHTGDGLIGFVVTKDGLQTPPRNWPRAIHEGNWSPVIAPALNIIVSVVFVGLWLTGLVIWARRTLRMRRRRAEGAGRLQPAE